MKNLLITITTIADEVVEVKKVRNDMFVEVRIGKYPFVVVYDSNGYYYIVNNKMREYFSHYNEGSYCTKFYKGLEEAFAELQGDLEDAGLL